MQVLLTQLTQSPSIVQAMFLLLAYCKLRVQVLYFKYRLKVSHKTKKIIPHKIYFHIIPRVTLPLASTFCCCGVSHCCSPYSDCPSSTCLRMGVRGHWTKPRLSSGSDDTSILSKAESWVRSESIKTSACLLVQEEQEEHISYRH